MEGAQGLMPQGLMTSGMSGIMSGGCHHPIEDVVLNIAVGMLSGDVVIALTHFIHGQDVTETDERAIEHIQKTVFYLRSLQQEPFSMSSPWPDDTTRHSALLILEVLRTSGADEEQVLGCLENPTTSDEETLRVTRDVFIQMGELMLSRSHSGGCFG